jgi:hypothetical protein
MQRNDKPKPQDKNEEVAVEKKPKLWKSFRNVIIKFRPRFNTTNIIVLATIIIALDGMWQVFIARDTENRQLRAYLGIFYAKNESSSGIFKAIYIIKNTGQTPAYNVKTSIRTGCKPLSSKVAFDTSLVHGGHPSTSIISPGDPAYIEQRIPVSDSVMIFLNNGSAAFFTWGELQYMDVFGNTHTTKFRFTSDLPDNPFEMVPDSADNEAN